MTLVTQLKLKLADANFHVAQGNKHIARQRRLIAKLEHNGHDTIAAREVLDVFLDSQILHERHRDNVLATQEVRRPISAPDKFPGAVSIGRDTGQYKGTEPELFCRVP
jgi:hypothetical protein